MSIKLMAIVWDDARLSGATKLVALSLADFANDEGRCWPSVETIARKASITARSVRRVISELEESGRVIVERSEGGRATNLYRVVPAKFMDAPEPPDSPENSEEVPDSPTPDILSPLTPTSGHPGHTGQGTPDVGVSRTTKEPSENHQSPAFGGVIDWCDLAFKAVDQLGLEPNAWKHAKAITGRIGNTRGWEAACMSARAAYGANDPVAFLAGCMHQKAKAASPNRTILKNSLATLERG